MGEPVQPGPSPTLEPFLKALPKGTTGHAHHSTKDCQGQHPQGTCLSLAAWLTPVSHWKSSSGLRRGPGNTALPAAEAKPQPGWILSPVKNPLPALRSSAGGPEARSVSRGDATQLAVSLSLLSPSVAHEAERNLMGKKDSSASSCPENGSPRR